MNDILLSIVIPVFNAERYIADCVASLENRKSKGIEILLVNDGSTDSSLAVCHCLAQGNNTIRVIDSENKGVSAARNLGMQNANGKWILFVDADDYLEAGAVDYIIENLPQNENVMCRFGMCKDYYRNGILYESKRLEYPFFIGESVNYKKEFSIKDDFNTLFENNVFDSACLCLFNKSVVKSNGLLFIEGMRVREDTEFLLHYLEIVETVEVWNRFLYHYRIDGDEGYSLRRETRIVDIERIASRYMRTLSTVCKEQKGGEEAVSYFVYQLFYGGIVHIATTNPHRYMKIKEYSDSAMCNPLLYNMIIKATSHNKFHKVLLTLFKRRWSSILSVICCFRLQ